ncbi:hypothetical protein PIB30_009368 [Stylosanthes scabra]|uniref:Uncharacterized protein n=1 Tax=Stylosanthes scabra TaxID=79078 RepID=A0ABU6V5F7_9FABA|nr:hypothetical protein [Stylosanthes scabra]
MASATATAIEPLFVLLLLLPVALHLSPLMASEPVPATWPEQFHSVLFINRSGSLQKVDLWYDWPNGRNFNIIQHQLGVLSYDLEWDNGTSFYYTLPPFNHTCKVVHFDVGILRPNWLDGATFLGVKNVDNFLCNVWEKADFITYYEHVLTHTPVMWVFSSGMVAHVMTFEVGAVLDDPNWQAPVYCFTDKDGTSHLLEPSLHDLSHGRTLIRGIPNTAHA